MQVNGEVFDLDRVLEGDCTLEFLKFEDDEGKLNPVNYTRLVFKPNYIYLFGILRWHIRPVWLSHGLHSEETESGQNVHGKTKRP